MPEFVVGFEKDRMFQRGIRVVKGSEAIKFNFEMNLITQFGTS